MSKNMGIHGGDIIATAKELGCAVDEIIDMSGNLTPLGMAPGLKEYLASRLDEIRFLPETGSEKLVALFAAKHGLSVVQVMAGNGTTEFIYGVPEMLGLRRAIIVEPTYSDYRTACQWFGITAKGFPLLHEEDFRLDLTRLASILTGGELVFVCNPNNPTSGITPSAALHQMALEHPETAFLVDESYLSFLRQPSLLDFPMLENLFVLGSFSKVYGIPGLRLGFLGCTETNMARLKSRSKPWGVNCMAQIAGEFLLQHGDGYVEEVISFLEQNRPRFAVHLAAMPGVEVVPGAAHFILCFLRSSMRAGELAEKMLARKIMIRNCANFSGLDDRYFRLSMQNADRNARCLAALGEILEGGK